MKIHELTLLASASACMHTSFLVQQEGATQRGGACQHISQCLVQRDGAKRLRLRRQPITEMVERQHADAQRATDLLLSQIHRSAGMAFSLVRGLFGGKDCHAHRGEKHRGGTEDT
ncbi:hypothetical protein ASF11_07870 [Acidovorax sp. Leaf76]|nr:hypothetical protein ASF11_07870 [Acidovorax sp. Leaf76]KQO32207.1 hypothetical protein ASF19_06745 [Acidovorax sp. Leaf84]KQS31768.1 hypothetical protein ASG27_06990 [Acidovorax sp. Leaf191]